MENQSARYSLNKHDGMKILKGLLVAVGGAVLVYVADTIPKIDFGSLTPVAVALASVLVNVGQKFLRGDK